MKNLLLIAMVLMSSLLTAQVRLTKVDPMANTVKIKNFGMSAVNIGSYVICDNAGNYPMVTSVNAPMTLMAGQEVTLNLGMSAISLNTMMGNVALYMNSSNYMMPANMADFFQWGAASGGRESVAVSKGIWMMGMFIAPPAPYTYTGNGTEMGNRMPFWQNSTGGGGGGGMMMMDIPHLDELLFAARLTAAQGVTTSGQGVSSFLLNDSRDSICYEINVNALSGPITAAHVHGADGSVVLNLSDNISGNTIKGAITGADVSANLMMFLKGDLFVNVHTAQNPSGEIKGQIRLESDMLFRGLLTPGQHVHNVNTNGMDPEGLIAFTLSQDKKTVKYMVQADSMTGAIQMATFMYGKPGTVGAMVYNETMNIMMGMPIVTGTIDVSANAAFVDSLMAGSVYVNLTTSMNPAGELRGQLNMDKNLSMDVMLDTAQVMSGTVVGANPMGLGYSSINYTLDTLRYDVLIWNLSGEMTNVQLLDATDMDNMVPIMNITANANGNRVTGMIAGSALTEEIINLALRGDICFSVATMLNPMGEAAGHITKFARDGFVFSMSADQVTPMASNSGAVGSGIIALNRDWTDAHYMFAASGLESGFASANFRLGAAGETGQVEKNVTTAVSTEGSGLFGGGFWKGTDMTLPFMPMVGNHFVADSIYLEINTMLSPGGEIRGQTSFASICSNDISTGINSVPEVLESLSLYPNPTNGQATVSLQLTESANVAINVYNSVGQVVIKRIESGYTGENTYALDLSSMSRGVYFVEIRSGNDTIRAKLIVR